VLHLNSIHVPVDPAWFAVIFSGYPLVYLAVWKIINNKGIMKISSSLLITIAMIAAIYINEFFAAGQVAFIMAIGAALEEKTIKRARRGIEKLISLAPETARVIKNGDEIIIGVGAVQINDILRVLPGEAVPVDGEIISGDTSIDQSIITGESLPIDKTAGDDVYCGTINRFGVIEIKATKVGEDSSLSKLIRLVREAEENKAPIQRIVDKWAVWLVPSALLIAIIAYIVTQNITTAVTIMIVFCPCALALATPTSIMAAIGQAAKYGVIIKSGEALEKMGMVDIIAFDKTGTLTFGSPVVSDIISFDSGMSENDILAYAASVEFYSEHPLGKAIAVYAKQREVTLFPIEDFLMIPGRGISCDIKGKKIICGNSAFLYENNIEPDDTVKSALSRLQSQGKATIIVSLAGECIGVIALSDTLRPTAEVMVSELHKKHTETVLLTGDNKNTADYFAGQVGITKAYAELRPTDKVEKIIELQKLGHKICMIGDGVNDAPALKTANVGVAMGSMGSDIAIDAADIALMGDDIAKLPYLKRLSNAAVKTIRLSLIFSLVFNFTAITLAFLGILNPITGALAHNAGSIAVVLNAVLLYDRKYI
jgi:heavy metal translocating P-type ATPase